jgi:hypothetical protein
MKVETAARPDADFAQRLDAIEVSLRQEAGRASWTEVFRREWRLFALFCGLGWTWIYRAVPETKGQSLEQIQQLWNEKHQ